MKAFLLLLLSSAALAAASPQPEVPTPKAADPSDVRAVMFYVTIDRSTGVWTHAQVVGGYKDHDDCTRAVSLVGAATASDLGPSDIPIFLCPELDVDGIVKKQDAATPEAPQVPLKKRTQTPSNAT
jgi:hypothetical protein